MADGTVHDPIHRVSFAFAHEPGGLVVETWLEDGGHLPEHFHPTLEETWEVRAGTLRLKLDGRWQDFIARDGPLVVARGVRHELRNDSGATVHLRTLVTPPGELEGFLTESAEAARAGLYTRRNLPTSLRGARWVAAFAQRFRHETVMCSPPPAIQRVVLPLLAGRGGRGSVPVPR